MAYDCFVLKRNVGSEIAVIGFFVTNKSKYRGIQLQLHPMLSNYNPATSVTKFLPYTYFRRHRWKAISPIGIDVTVPWSVCLSVCLSLSCIVFKRQKILTRFDFICTRQPHVSAILPLKFGLHRSTSSSPNVAQSYPVPTLCWSKSRRHSRANCVRMVRDITMVTMDGLQCIWNHHRSF